MATCGARCARVCRVTGSLPCLRLLRALWITVPGAVVLTCALLTWRACHSGGYCEMSQMFPAYKLVPGVPCSLPALPGANGSTVPATHPVVFSLHR